MKTMSEETGKTSETISRHRTHWKSSGLRLFQEQRALPWYAMPSLTAIEI